MRKILIIEDNHPNLYMLTYLLEHSGFEVISATSGEDGLRRAEADLPDLILTDLQLPCLDGFEIARRVKATPTTSDIPVVAVSAYAMPGDREKALASGCSGYFEKPITTATFAADLEKFFPV